MRNTHHHSVSRRKWTRAAAIAWGVIVGGGVCIVLWESGELTVGLTLGILSLSIGIGFGVATLIADYLAKNYGSFKDDE